MYRMLIVDDEKNERDCILYLLKNCGFELEIKEAEDGVEALQILKIWPAHILFTDVQMPRMDGLELIREALNLYPDIRPIIFSGYADFAYAKTAISLGVENYILKPVVPDEFTKTLSSLIGQLDEDQANMHMQENQKLFLLQYSLQLAIFGNFDKTKAEPFILEQFSAFRYMVMFTFKNDFLMHQSDAFFDDLRSFLTPEAVSVNISPEQAVLFEIRFLMPDISAHVFLITLRVLFLLTAALQLQSHYLNMIPSSRHFLLLSSKWNSVFFCQIPLFFFQTLHKHSVWKIQRMILSCFL